MASMTGELDYSLPPAIRRISSAFRRVGWISFWTQAVLAIVSSLVLLFAVASLSVRAGGQNNPGTGAGLVFAVAGLVTLYIGAYWAYRYTRLGKQLRTGNPDSRPKPKDAVQALRVGLMISLTGMLLTLLGGQAIIGTLLAKSLSTQGTFLLGAGNVTQFVQPLDIFIVQANTNTIAAHFVAIVASLWLSRSVNRQ
ncbi:MAG: DUF3611 family protein [Cyanobacteria bacterium P01_A01_bin.123]